MDVIKQMSKRSISISKWYKILRFYHFTLNGCVTMLNIMNILRTLMAHKDDITIGYYHWMQNKLVLRHLRPSKHLVCVDSIRFKWTFST